MKSLFGYCLRAAGLLVLTYAAIVVAGLTPCNEDFEEAIDGIEIFISTNAVHAEFILPVDTDTIDWRDVFPARCFPTDTSDARHIAIGWGEENFFLETPTWADLKLSTVSHALLTPSGACIHATMKTSVSETPDRRSVRISKKQYGDLVRYICRQLKRDSPEIIDSEATVIPDESYGSRDAFFKAHGTYHCLNTCNTWVGRGMAVAGMRVGRLTPMPRTVFLYLPPPNPS